MLQCNTVFLSVLVRSEATGQEWLVEHLRCRRTTVSKAGSGGGDYWTGRQAGGEQKTQGEREKPGNLICVNNRFSIHSIVGPSVQSRERKMICMRWEEKGREVIWGLGRETELGPGVNEAAANNTHFF